MTDVAIIRCEKNENRCFLTACFKSLFETREGVNMARVHRQTGLTCVKGTVHLPGGYTPEVMK